MKLIITEKPSVARDIARVLKINQKKNGYFEGNGSQITWALGHLIEFCQPDEYDPILEKWSFEQLPIIPETFKKKAIKNSIDQYNVVKQLCSAEHITEVICATDAGREGELIFRLIYEDANCKAPIKRLWISSQTDEAIKDGFLNLKEGIEYDPLYRSALSRAEADWLVGINATRAYSIKFSRGHGVMSIGRVQTPVLKMIVDRYREHIQFESKTFFEIFIDVQHKNGSFLAKWYLDKPDTQFEDRLYDKSVAETIVEELKANPQGKILKLTQKEKKEKQPLLYDLTELQKDANKKFKFSADQTLKLMQDLYEKFKLLTYPRTSSRYLSTDIAPKLPALVNQLAELPQYEGVVDKILEHGVKIAPRMIDDKKVTDHHAIIPTDKKPSLNGLSSEHLAIYNLVIKRFLAAFMPECEKHFTEIITGFGQHVCKSTGTITTKPGWREVYDSEPDEDSSLSKKKKKNEEDIQLPLVVEGDFVEQEKVDLKKGQTKAPPLHTEASILAAMETAGKAIDDEELRQAMKDCGLGTPATRAQILEKLINVKYIVREKNKLSPTQKGEYIIDNIKEEAFLSPDLTGQWEKKLNDMAKNEFDRDKYMSEIKEFTKELVENVEKSEAYVLSADQKIYGNCPKCGDGKIFESKKAWGCSNWKEKECKFAIWKDFAGKTITEKQVETLFKKGVTSVIKGFKSKSGNPFNAALKIQDGDVVFDFQKESIGICPLCEGDIVETAKAYSCDNWREKGCKFAIWKDIAKRKIKKDEAKKLIKDGKLENLEGFTSKAGKPFSATLVLQGGRVNMQFN